MIVKLDMENSIDRVSREFLFKVMTNSGFDAKFIH